MGEILGKLITENVMDAKVRLPQEPLSRNEVDIAKRWNILPKFHNFENLKVVSRRNICWNPPTSPTVKLNFDGAIRKGLAAAGDVLVAYLVSLGQGTNNMVESIALLWGLKIVVEMKVRILSIKGNSKLIIDSV